jgi:hypothetical protein
MEDADVADPARRPDSFRARNVCFGVAAFVSQTSPAYDPLLHRDRIFGRGNRSGRKVVASGHGGRQRVKVAVLKYGDDVPPPPNPQQKAEAKAIDRDARAAARTATK